MKDYITSFGYNNKVEFMNGSPIEGDAIALVAIPHKT